MHIVIILLIFIFIIYALLKSYRECNSCDVNIYDIYTEKNIGNINILFLADFHNSSNEKILYNLNDILAKNNNEDEKIDFILSAGDMITYRPKRNGKIYFDNFIKLLQILKKYGRNLIYGFGNHEERLLYTINNPIEFNYKRDIKEDINEYNIFKTEIEKYNIKNIIDENINLNKNIKLYNINLKKDFYNKNIFYKNIEKKLTDDIIKEHIGDIDKNYYNIILCHNPDYAKRLIEYGFDLVLSGHQHGGLVRLPFIGAVFSPELTLFPPYSKGNYIYKNKNIVVSGGLGQHTIKIRFNNTPEIIKLKIRKR